MAWPVLLPILAALAQSPEAPDRPRLIVLTDISSLTAGMAEPDDGQSMIRLMLYANDVDIEGLVASSNMGHGQTVRPDLIEAVVEAYGQVQPNLARHDPRYPTAEVLKKTIKAGQPIAGPEVPVTESVGDNQDTEASNWIIQVVDRPDPRPVWVTIWGGSADLAQALWRVRHSRSKEELNTFLSKIRVHSIHDQDSTGPWIKEHFPGLFYITSQRAYRGMYRGGDVSLVSSDWVETHIRHGHGPLGALYPNYRGGDIWSGTLGPVRGIKEGDSPSFLSLVPNGLGDPSRLWAGSWGGRFEGHDNRFTDVPDLDLPSASDPDPRMSSVYRWRPAFQADFQARLDWCVLPPEKANHPPVVRIDGPRERTVSPGSVVTLDARGSSDPEGKPLRVSWSLYPKSEETREVVLDDPESGMVHIKVPEADRRRTIPVLLMVEDRGQPPLTRYGRVFLTVEPSGRLTPPPGPSRRRRP